MLNVHAMFQASMRRKVTDAAAKGESSGKRADDRRLDLSKESGCKNGTCGCGKGKGQAAQTPGR